MSDTGIIKPLRARVKELDDRVKDLELINKEHQEKNGKLRQEIQDKDKKMSKLKREVAHLSLTNINLQRGR
jgi:FtsZ-binding cell division protein ZapB|tara:strand:+ start:315 stop:527 length:213 start_codon:yes stop_codon:yes gene_type:complete